MTVYRYEEISAVGRKSGKCYICGKRATRQRTFTNTLNPFNRNPDGSIRTRREVYQVVSAQAREWESGPVCHEGCAA